MSKKRVLLLTDSWNGYLELINAMTDMGLIVDYFPKCCRIKKGLNSFWRLLRSLVVDCKLLFFNKIVKNKEQQIYSKYLKALNDKYDYVFDFGARCKLNCLELIKLKYPDATYLLYLWDDYKYLDNVKPTERFFDKIFSYNMEDAKQNDFIFRPSFYQSPYIYKGEQKDIDIFYIGGYREKARFKIIKMISEKHPNLALDMRLYLKKGHPKNLFLSVEKDDFKKYITHSYCDLGTLASLYKRSKALLDIAYKNQYGLGLRPFEALASKSKLITTNAKIKEYDFFDENNVFVLNKNLSNIGEIGNFMIKDYRDPPMEVIYKYSMKAFVEDLFSAA